MTAEPPPRPRVGSRDSLASVPQSSPADPAGRAELADRGHRARRSSTWSTTSLLSRGAQLPGGDLRTLAVLVFVLIVLVAGSLITYLVVPQPTGSGTVRRRSRWSAALGLFAAVPIAYLVLVVEGQILRPLLELKRPPISSQWCAGAPLRPWPCSTGSSPFVLFRATLHSISSGADRLAGIQALRFFVSEEQHLALPHLYGAPAYSRPPRSVEQVARPFDPDELPIEADRTDEDALLLAELAGSLDRACPAAGQGPQATSSRADRTHDASTDKVAVSAAVAVARRRPAAEEPSEQPSLQGGRSACAASAGSSAATRSRPSEPSEQEQGRLGPRHSAETWRNDEHGPTPTQRPCQWPASASASDLTPIRSIVSTPSGSARRPSCSASGIDTLRRWEASHKLRVIRTSGGQRIVPILEVSRLLAERRRDTADRPIVAQSARNRFAGIVTRVERDGVAAVVEVLAGPHRLVSLMTAEAVDELDLAVGQRGRVRGEVDQRDRRDPALSRRPERRPAGARMPAGE